MVVQMTVESQSFISIIILRSTVNDLYVLTVPATMDTADAFLALSLGFGVEGHAFKCLAAVIATETFWVESCARGADDAASDWQGTGFTQGR